MTTKESKIKIASVRLFSALFVLFAIMSCGPVNNNTSQISTEPAAPVLQQPVSTDDAAEVASEMLETDEEPATELLQILEEQSSEEIEATNSQVALNPPHGEPGHTCDLPVGAPLNSAPAATTVNTAPVTNTGNTVPATNSQVALNPPHGEPGHTCDLPVGAPLNSATASAQTTSQPVSPAAAVLSNTNGSIGPTLENLQRLNAPQPVGLAVPELNPPHGQPFHRCDIPVGAPLPS